MRIIILLLFVFSAHAEPFNISLPVSPQFNPAVLAKGDMSFTLSFIDKSDNFQLQVRNKTDVDHFLNQETDEGVAMGLSLGLGAGFEVGVNGGSENGVWSLKYDIGSNESNWSHSIVLGYITGISTGHGGNIIPEPEEECGFLDFFCYFNIFDFLCFGSCADPVTYEYNYEADISGGMLGYMQGYQTAPSLLLYWGVHYINYDIDVRVTDNTGAYNNTTDTITTDLFSLSTGLRWKVGKPDKDGRPSYILLNLTPIKYSSQHDGNFDSEIQFSYINEF